MVNLILEGVAVILEDLRTAHRELLAAHDAWTCELREVCQRLKNEQLVSVAQKMDEAFKRFLHASEMIHRQVERPRSRLALERNARMRVDLEIARGTYVALSRSFVILNRTEAGQGYHAVLAAAGIHDQAARDWAPVNGSAGTAHSKP